VRVLHVVAAVAPRYGGPSRNVIGLCSAARGAAVDAEVCTTDADGDGARLPGAHEELQTWKGVPVRIFERSFSERYKVSPSLARWLRSSVKNYDLVVAHGCFSHAPEAAASAARNAGVPYVFVPHGMLSEWALRRTAKRLYFHLRTRRLVRHASGFLCTSREEQKEVERCGGRAPSISVRWGIDPELLTRTPSDPTAWKETIDLPTNCRVVLFLGRLHPKKGVLDQLLPAVKNLSDDVATVIAGPVDSHAPSYASTIRENVARSGLGKRVRIIGPLEGESKIAALDACDVFVLPSYSENFGLTVAEAMARARSVVVSDQVQIAEDVTRAGAGLVTPLQPEALASCISTVLADRELARRMGAAGRRFAAEHFSWSTAGEQVKRFYERIIADSQIGRFPD
jgi:glycosyltransferase involved in cell wall biosynthesis